MSFPVDDGSLTPYSFELGYQLVTLVYDTVMIRDDRGVPTPWLARSVTMDPAGLEVTIDLREGITFHDGSPLTSRDVAFRPEVRRRQSPSPLHASGRGHRLHRDPGRLDGRDQAVPAASGLPRSASGGPADPARAPVGRGRRRATTAGSAGGKRAVPVGRAPAGAVVCLRGQRRLLPRSPGRCAWRCRSKDRSRKRRAPYDGVRSTLSAPGCSPMVSMRSIRSVSMSCRGTCIPAAS